MPTLFIAQGLEEDRILAAIFHHLPTKVVIIRNRSDVSDKLTKEVERIISRVKKEARRLPSSPTWEEIWVDFFSPIEALIIIHSAMSKEEDVRVDISSGNKVVSTVMYVLASDLGADVTYSTASEYGKTPTYGRLVALPRLPLDLGIDLEFLSILTSRRRWESLSELAEAFLGRSDKASVISVSRKLEPISELGLVRVRRKGKRKIVEVKAGKSI